MDSNAWRVIAGRSMSRLRALVALLCVLCIVISAVFVIRPVPAAARAFQGYEAILTVSQSSGSKKPCERGGLSRVGTTCNTVVFLDASAGAVGVIERSASAAGIRPLSGNALGVQWLAGSPFRPPRDLA
ncbi:hypothetical protein [Rhodopseudomonas sp. P2A-2r]|uniref:hypothetical protein n=1 Tax=unclassified Rhodopseudomonas TaxID=2638247 RepID=UPI0022344F3D|nr:hypothetical protein [Rhodopseudomonas sp. P2A-2r]UZE46930.1 hypothetical protein ONR75_18105 [Rhodopseudomonas sp. P2A-2r]